jgi:hypothetical protein
LFGLGSDAFPNTHFGAHFRKQSNIPPTSLRDSICICHVFHHTTKYLGLGVPIIIESFSNPSEYDFLLKILFTGFTLGAGFKVVKLPRCFIGATWEVPYPFCSITSCTLAGMGFVAVFLELIHQLRTVMGMELFGSGLFVGLGFIAYLASGPVGFTIPKCKGPNLLYQKFKRKLDNFLILKQTLISKYFQLYIKKM